MKYYLFLDETGDHSLRKIDKDFPVFILAGILISSEQYELLKIEFNRIKLEFWNNQNIIFHSTDIRRCQKGFEILFDRPLKEKFYENLNKAVINIDYKVISTAIDKRKYIKKYGNLRTDVYEWSLSFILERTIYCLKEKKDGNELDIIIEQRGKRKDNQLKSHIARIKQIGTYFVSRKEILKYGCTDIFLSKKSNINRLQLADLIAYLIAKYIINPNNENLPFQNFKDKFYSKDGNITGRGLKIFP